MGGGRGIGLVAAVALAGAGGHVTLVVRNRGEIEAAAEMRAGDEQAEALLLDVTDSAAVHSVPPFHTLLQRPCLPTGCGFFKAGRFVR